MHNLLDLPQEHKPYLLGIDLLHINKLIDTQEVISEVIKKMTVMMMMMQYHSARYSEQKC